MSKKDRNLLLTIAAVFGIILIAVVGFLRYQNAPEQVFRKVVEPMVGELANTKWSGKTLIKYGSPEYDQWILDNHLMGGFPGFAVLGHAVKFLGFESIALSDEKNFVSLVALYQFERGPVSVTMQLIRHEQHWQIYTFSLDSPIFAKPAPAN